MTKQLFLPASSASVTEPAWSLEGLWKLFQTEERILRYIQDEISRIPPEGSPAQTRLRIIAETHLIQLRRSFFTKTDYSLVLFPLAHCNLEELLTAYTAAKHGFVSLNESWLVDRDVVTEWLKKSFKSLADAVDCIHALGVRHRDITPKNILYRSAHVGETPEGTLCLCDFGVAYRHEAHPGPSATETPISAINRRWTSPERRDDLAESFQDDIFNVGLVFLEIYTVLKGSSIRNLVAYLEEHKAPADEWITSITIHEIYCRQNVVADWLATLSAPGDQMPEIIAQAVRYLISRARLEA